jgi:hypothetical protein
MIGLVCFFRPSLECGRYSSWVCVSKIPPIRLFVDDFHEVIYSNLGGFVFERFVSQSRPFWEAMYRFDREARGESQCISRFFVEYFVYCF